MSPGLPDGLFSNKNPNLGKFWRVLQWTLILYGHLVQFTVFYYILWTFGIARFGIFYQEKSGNPVCHPIGENSPKVVTLL
jgi:hypothetical protein